MHLVVPVKGLPGQGSLGFRVPVVEENKSMRFGVEGHLAKVCVCCVFFFSDPFPPGMQFMKGPRITIPQIEASTSLTEGKAIQENRLNIPAQ